MQARPRSFWCILLAVLSAVATLTACSARPPTLGDSDGSTPLVGTATCATPSQGCPCATDQAQVACGEVVRRSGDYVTCSEGTRTCVDGAWGACIGDKVFAQSVGSVTPGGLESETFQTTPTACKDNPCDPLCNNYVDNGTGIDAGSTLTITDAGGVTIYGSDGGACTGYQCQVPKCSGNGTTTLTGTVYDPAGLNPVYHAYVYIPIALPLPAIPVGAQQDPCGGGGNLPPAVSYFYTGADGKFTLTGVPSGANIPLVVQAGKWRRMVMLSSVTACTSTAVPAAQSRLPQNKTDGYNSTANLPQIALVSGACDPMECLLERIGISTSEFTSPGAGGRIDYYQGYGEPLAGGTNPAPTNLLGSSTQMMKEDLIMLPCDCGDEYYPYRVTNGRWAGNYGTFLTNVTNYANGGGRLFTSHWGRQWIEGGGVQTPFANVASWISYGSSGGYDTPDFEGQINTGFTKGADFATWMQNAGAQTSLGYFLINPTRYDTNSVTTNSQLWVSYTGRETSNNGKKYKNGDPTGPADFTFDTPVGAQKQYGRVMFTDMHLASGFNTTSFPSECPTGGLTSQEKAAEFLLFDLGACLTATPPSPPKYAQTSMTRDYQAVCPAGKVPVWRFFDWKTITPSDSSLVFNARTADTQALLATATPVAALGSASGAPITVWTGSDVKAALAPAPSRTWLRVTITFNPSSDAQSAPTLSAWRQDYDCVDGQ